MVGIPALLTLYVKRSPSYDYKKERLVINSFFLIWLLLLLFRSEKIGIDINVYKYHFVNYSKFTWSELFEKIIGGEIEAGYATLIKVVTIFSDDFRWVLVMCALIAVVPIWKLYSDESESVKESFLVIVLFLNIAPFVMYFSGLRQAMAMAFIAPCYLYCRNKELFKFLICVLVACLFHQSAFIILILYPVYHLRLKRDIHILYLVPVVGIIYYFNVPIFKFLLLFLQEKYLDRYGDSISSTGAYSMLLLLSVLLIYAFLIPDQKELDDDTIGLRNILFLCVIMQVFAGVHTIAMRMNYYFLLLVPLLIPKIMTAGKEKYEALIRVSKICMIAFFAFYYFYFAYTDKDILSIYPYQSLFYEIFNPSLY